MGLQCCDARVGVLRDRFALRKANANGVDELRPFVAGGTADGHRIKRRWQIDSAHRLKISECGFHGCAKRIDIALRAEVASTVSDPARHR